MPYTKRWLLEGQLAVPRNWHPVPLAPTDGCRRNRSRAGLRALDACWRNQRWSRCQRYRDEVVVTCRKGRRCNQPADRLEANQQGGDIQPNHLHPGRFRR